MVHYAKERFYTNPGEKVIPVYGPKVKPDGTITVVEVGKTDLNAYIQAQKESTDMAFILAKLANGDTSVLNQRQGFYGDFTQMPKSFAEMLQYQIDAKEAFDHLPIDVKAKFNNDVNQFMASAGNEDWYEKMSMFVDRPVVVEEKESEVTE